MTLNELIFDIKSAVMGGNPTDDWSYTNLQVAYWVRLERATLIKAALSKRFTPNECIQSFKIFLKCENPLEEFNLSTKTTHKESVVNVPQLITARNFYGITAANYFKNVSTSDNTHIIKQPVTILNATNVEYIKSTKVSNGMCFCYYADNKIRVANMPTDIEVLSVNLILEIPEDETVFTGKSFYDYDSSYPCPADMCMQIKDNILRKYFGLLRKTTSDKVNDNQPNNS